MKSSRKKVALISSQTSVSTLSEIAHDLTPVPLRVVEPSPLPDLLSDEVLALMKEADQNGFEGLNAIQLELVLDARLLQSLIKANRRCSQNYPDPEAEALKKARNIMDIHGAS